MVEAHAADHPGIAFEAVMTGQKILLAISASMAMFVANSAHAKYASAPVPSYDHEKCYGVAKAGHNDCQSATNACGKLATVDADPSAWVYLPRGSCEKLVGGALLPPEQ
jgi:uncharacterized membrane protein